MNETVNSKRKEESLKTKQPWLEIATVFYSYLNFEKKKVFIILFRNIKGV